MTVEQFLNDVCNHGIVRKICQWCQRDLADAGFVPTFAFEPRPHPRTAIEDTKYEYRCELLERGGLL